MKLEKNEFTSRGLIDHLTERFGTKHSGKPFTISDVTQYARRGFLPHRYGGNKLEIQKQQGIKIIRVLDEIHRQEKSQASEQ